jgi:hypothetical protein
VPLGLESEFKQLDKTRLDKTIGALLGTQRVRLTAQAVIARAAGSGALVSDQFRMTQHFTQRRSP